MHISITNPVFRASNRETWYTQGSKKTNFEQALTRKKAGSETGLLLLITKNLQLKPV